MFQTMTKATANIVIIAIVLGILILINILAGDMHNRWDLTADKLYTLSETSKEVVANLPDELIVTLYSSMDLPTSDREIRKKVIDLIEEYRVYANSNFVFREEYPDIEDEEEVKKLQEKGISPRQLGGELSGGATTTEVGVGYLDLLISYGGKDPVPISRLEYVDSLEYPITHAIFKLTMEDMPVIGVYAGAGINPTTEEGGFFALARILENQYPPVENIDLSNGKPVPDDVKTMIILSPESFRSGAKVVLDQFIMRGGKVVFLLDTIDTSMQQGPRGKRKPAPWADFLSHYGLKVDASLVVDLASDTMIQYQKGNRIFFDRYPLWVNVKKDGFGELGFTSNLESVELRYISPVEYIGDQSNEDINVSVIFKSSEESFAIKDPYNLAYDQFGRGYQPPDDQEEFDLGLLVSGVFQSYYAGKEIPTVKNKEGVEEKVWDGEIIETSLKTEIVLIGSSQLFADTQLIRGGRLNVANAIFLMSMIDSLNLGKGLIELYTRNVTDRSLKDDLTDSNIAFMKFSGIYLIPILFSIIGVGRYVLRVQTKKMVEAKTLSSE